MGALDGFRGSEQDMGRSRPGDHPVVPDGIEPVIGWRYWFLHRGTLRSLNGFVQTPWHPRRPLRAQCGSLSRHVDGIPGQLCRCGIYAARDLETLKGLAQAGLHGPLVVGEVALWGRTIVAERGYRAEYGYPRSLWLVQERLPPSCSPDQTCAELAAAYGVPVALCEASWATSADQAQWAPIHPEHAGSLVRGPLITALGRTLILGILAALFAPLAANPLAYLTVLAVASLFILGVIVLAYGVVLGRVTARQFVAIHLALPFVAATTILLFSKR